MTYFEAQLQNNIGNKPGCHRCALIEVVKLSRQIVRLMDAVRVAIVLLKPVVCFYEHVFR